MNKKEIVKWILKTFLQEINLDISKIVSVKSKKDFIYFDKSKDGLTWEVIYSNGALGKNKKGKINDF